MDELLQSIIINTYNANPDLRHQAELALNQFLNTPGSLTGLLHVSANPHNRREMRQATGLVLKNRIRDYFVEREFTIKALPTSANEKDIIKQGIIEILLNETDNSLRGIFAEVIKVVSEFEFPEK